MTSTSNTIAYSFEEFDHWMKGDWILIGGEPCKILAVDYEKGLMTIRARTWRDRLWTSLLGLWDRLAYPFRYAENACVLWWWRGGFRRYWTRGDD